MAPRGSGLRPGEHLAGHPPGRPRHARLRLGLVIPLDPAVAVHVGPVLFRHVGHRQHQLRVPKGLVEDRAEDHHGSAGGGERRLVGLGELGVEHDHERGIEGFAAGRGPIGRVPEQLRALEVGRPLAAQGEIRHPRERRLLAQAGPAGRR